jgi:hypothetical protein
MSARKRLALDVALFLALLVANNPAWSGLAVHEWLSIALIVPALLHLVVNWEWTVRVARSFLDRLYSVSRLNLLVDGVLFVSTVAVMVSGVMVSQVALGALGIAASPSALWIAVHSVTADVTVVFLLVHFGLHWRWIARVLGAFPVAGSRPTQTLEER